MTTRSLAAVGLVFPLRGKQILLCRVRTELEALTLQQAHAVLLPDPHYAAALRGNGELRAWPRATSRNSPSPTNACRQPKINLIDLLMTFVFVLALRKAKSVQPHSFWTILHVFLKKPKPRGCYPSSVPSDFSLIGQLRFSLLRLCWALFTNCYHHITCSDKLFLYCMVSLSSA